MKVADILQVCLIVLILSTFASSQDEQDKVRVAPEIIAACDNVELGRAQISIPPRYPTEAKTARIGGLVKVRVQIEADGKVSKVLSIDGPELLRETAAESARKTMFSPTFCDGEAKPVTGLLTYRFNPYVFTESYFVPKSAEEFADISKESEFYESILYLTENYRLAFGFRDKKFHPDVPITKGEFAHFLRITLDLLKRRAKLANKTENSGGLFKPYNPMMVGSIDEVRFKNDQPYSESVSLLAEEYGIYLVDEKKKFAAKLPLTQNEVIDYWIAIFGSDAAPVNFEKVKNGDRIFTRGEFALFLQESLYVLTYKVLP